MCAYTSSLMAGASSAMTPLSASRAAGWNWSRASRFARVWTIYRGSGIVSWFFFFQAEDGIRDLTVTGVQTCALPICWGDTSIAVPVANGATTGNVVVIVGTIASNGVAFTVTSPGPSISTLNPTSGTVGDRKSVV